MKEKKVISGKRIVDGKASGEAIVSEAALCFRSQFDPTTGKVIDSQHPLYERSLAQKVLVMPSTTGSSGCRSGEAGPGCADQSRTGLSLGPGLCHRRDTLHTGSQRGPEVDSGRRLDRGGRRQRVNYRLREVNPGFELRWLPIQAGPRQSADALLPPRL